MRGTALNCSGVAVVLRASILVRGSCYRLRRRGCSTCGKQNVLVEVSFWRDLYRGCCAFWFRGAYRKDYDYALAHPEQEWRNRARFFRDKYFNSGYMQVGRDRGGGGPAARSPAHDDTPTKWIWNVSHPSLARW